MVRARSFFIVRHDHKVMPCVFILWRRCVDTPPYEAKSHDMMSFSARHCVGRHEVMPPIIQNPRLDEIQPLRLRLKTTNPPSLKWRQFIHHFLFVQKFDGGMRSCRRFLFYHFFNSLTSLATGRPTTLK